MNQQLLHTAAAVAYTQLYCTDDVQRQFQTQMQFLATSQIWKNHLIV